MNKLETSLSQNDLNCLFSTKVKKASNNYFYIMTKTHKIYIKNPQITWDQPYTEPDGATIKYVDTTETVIAPTSTTRTELFFNGVASIENYPDLALFDSVILDSPIIEPFELLTSCGLESLDLSDEDFQKEITFVKFLKDKYDDNFTETLYWDYRDELSATAQETILKDALENETTFETATAWYVEENMEWFPDYEAINKFYEQNPEVEEEDEFYLELFNDYIETDFNVEQLLRNSAPEDMTIYFGQSWDDDYRLIENRYNNHDTTVSTPIEWLIATQGYAPEDLTNEETVLKSPFLTSLNEELYDYDTELDGMQLIAIPDSNDFEAILAIARKQGVIKASTTFGLFNRIHGGGSGLSIELEKDIQLDESAPLYDITLAYRNNSYDYSPDAVYGLVRKKFTGEDLSED